MNSARKLNLKSVNIFYCNKAGQKILLLKVTFQDFLQSVSRKIKFLYGKKFPHHNGLTKGTIIYVSYFIDNLRSNVKDEHFEW